MKDTCRYVHAQAMRVPSHFVWLNMNGRVFEDRDPNGNVTIGWTAFAIDPTDAKLSADGDLMGAEARGKVFRFRFTTSSLRYFEIEPSREGIERFLDTVEFCGDHFQTMKQIRSDDIRIGELLEGAIFSPGTEQVSEAEIREAGERAMESSGGGE